MTEPDPDPAHEADMRAYQRQQLADDIGDDVEPWPDEAEDYDFQEEEDDQGWPEDDDEEPSHCEALQTEVHCMKS